MKKTITIMSLGIVFSGFGQNQISVKNAIPFKTVDKTTSENFGSSTSFAHGSYVPYQKAVLLQEDFESVTAPALPTGFTAQTQATAYSGFYTGTVAQASAGGFWPVPNNGSAKFVMTNDDVANADLCEELLVLPTLDFTGLTNIGFEFDVFHDKNYGSGDAEVRVSTNGGSSWTTLLILSVDAANWQHYAIPLTAYDNNASVTLALFWNDGGVCGTSDNWGTGLAVDNIIVQSIPSDNLTGNSLLPADITTDYEYTKLPLTQTRPIGMTFNISNNGLNNQSDVGFSYVISNGTPVNTGNSATAAINSFANDTIYHTSTYTPSALGNYSITATATMSATDEVPTDNIATTNLEITNNVWARDYTTFDGSFRNISGHNGAGVKIGHTFITTADQTFTSVQIGIENSAAHNGKLLFGEIYAWDGSQFNYLAATVDHTINNAVDGGNIINLCFIQEPFVAAGTEILVVAGHYGGALDASDHVRFATAGAAREGTVLGFTDAGLFQLLSPPAVVVRLASACFTSIEEQTSSMTLEQNIPNPTTGNTTVNYSLASTEDISFEITDMTGKLVQVVREGVKTAGSYTVNFNTNELSEGVYFYTLTNGTSRVTKSMVVTK